MDSLLDGFKAGSSLPGTSTNVGKDFLAKHYCRWGGRGAQASIDGANGDGKTRLIQSMTLTRYMPHIKMYGRFRTIANRDTDTDGVATDGHCKFEWLFVGSHNLSKAAWGAMQKNRTQLMVRSYEVGVLMTEPHREMTVDHQDADTGGGGGGSGDLAVPIPVPFTCPPDRYHSGDRPWMCDVMYPDPDVLGCDRMGNVVVD